ncbi:MAG TPA: alpha/beta fold hydrolase [Myxococcota bacterium]|nr:alpha/beta fold hydrolase [Myxococcota bacterium]
MPQAKANGIQLEYDTFGRASDAPLLLIMGLGAQMVLWDEEFCDLLAQRGHYVVRFDNRDVGLSTKFDHKGVPNVVAMMQPGADRSSAPYTLDDMADDAAGLLGALGVESAHIVGASMGGMIAQTVAYRHAPKTRSLVSIMSSTGNPALPQAKPEAMAVLMTPRPPDRASNVEASVLAARVIGSPGYPADETRVRQRAGMMFDRAFTPLGTVRQMAAIFAHGSRVKRLAAVTAPTLVIHGVADPLVPLEGGRDTAKSIPGAQLLEIEGMGHDLPPGLWVRLADAIAAHTKKAEGARR